MSLSDFLSAACFRFVHGRQLVYNTCWEDPRLDRVALELGADDTVAMITSAGCNALDYALESPRRIYAVDMNYRQNALLELKQAGIRRLDYETFFDLFGRGRHREHRDVYALLRRDLSPAAQRYWDAHIDFFRADNVRESFYFRGSSGMFAWLINHYIDRVAKVREAVEAAFAATTLEEQREIYHGQLWPAFWKRPLRWTVGRDSTLSLLGVPRAQRQQVDRHYTGGIVRFIEDSLEAVFAWLPLRDNYFWRVYLTGQYSADCCPEYLKPENFARLKAGLVDRVTTCTSSLTEFLEGHAGQISRYVLLDHMDWLAAHHRPLLEREWQAIVDRAAAGARVLWRSGGLLVDYVDDLSVRVANEVCSVGSLLTYQPELAAELHAKDRVHTYGSFYIADLNVA
jgi:S-adenosylmethionine-diacylglycerol 3-amino-3-carboxypropyl transferase